MRADFHSMNAILQAACSVAAAAIHAPFEHHGADEPDSGNVVGESAEHVSAPFDLSVQAQKRIGPVNPSSVPSGEAHEDDNDRMGFQIEISN